MSRWPWRSPVGRRRMKGCAWSKRALQSYVDGETDPTDTRLVFAHVEQCRRCRLDLSIYMSIRHALARYPGPDEAAVARLRRFAESLSLGRQDASEDAVPEAEA
jgi:anti-sigma factor RsiW